MSKIFGYVYKITHIPSGRYYIGQHKGDSPESDGYMGSGKEWIKIVAQHPKLEFKKEILAMGKSRKELLALEKSFVGELYRDDPLCQNCIAGGGNPPTLDTFSPESRENQRAGLRKFYTTERGKARKAATSLRMKGNIMSEEVRTKISKSHFGIRPSEETRRKMSISAKNRPKRTLSEEQKRKISEAITRWHRERLGG